jgi:hypothetical protein
MDKKLIIKEIDKLKSAVHEDRVVTEYLIYVMIDGNSNPLEAYTELGDSAKSARINELILIHFSDDELSGFKKEEIIEEVSFEEYIKELKRLWKK